MYSWNYYLNKRRIVISRNTFICRREGMLNTPEFDYYGEPVLEALSFEEFRLRFSML